MKDLYDTKDPLLWDEAIPEVKKEKWIKLIAEAVRAEEIIFPRSSRPKNSVGGPHIGGFADGAFPAFGGNVYLIWEHGCPEIEATCTWKFCQGDRGHFTANLILGKGRVTPLNGYTIPRSELSSGVLITRMTVRVARALDSMIPWRH